MHIVAYLLRATLMLVLLVSSYRAFSFSLSRSTHPNAQTPALNVPRPVFDLALSPPGTTDSSGEFSPHLSSPSVLTKHNTNATGTRQSAGWPRQQGRLLVLGVGRHHAPHEHRRGRRRNHPEGGRCRPSLGDLKRKPVPHPPDGLQHGRRVRGVRLERGLRGGGLRDRPFRHR